MFEIKLNDWLLITGLVSGYDPYVKDNDGEEYLEDEETRYSQSRVPEMYVTFSGEPMLCVGRQDFFVVCRPISRPDALETVDLRQYVVCQAEQEYVNVFYQQYFNRWELFTTHRKQLLGLLQGRENDKVHEDSVFKFKKKA